MNIYSDLLTVRFDEQRQALLIEHPDSKAVINPLIEMKLTMLQAMDFEQASQFIGERLILLMPGLRPHFSQYFKE